MKRIKRTLENLFMAYLGLAALYGLITFWMDIGRTLVEFQKNRRN